MGKTAKAVYDQHDAKETNEEAEDIIEKAKNGIEVSRKNSGDAINDLGEMKLNVLDKGIKRFITSFEKLHNVDFTDSSGLKELAKFKIDKQEFDKLREIQTISTSIVAGVAGGAAAGAVAAFGAYGATMAFAAASTGTAIATLSGVAATNATLAFLGGGSLAAGGLGIAGGTAALGGLVAGPALVVLGFVVGAKASANRDKAYSNLAEARKFEEEMKTARIACKGIRMRANLFTRTLIKLSAIFDPLVYSLEEIIETSGTDYSKFTPEQKKTVAASMSIAGAIKSILDTPILTEDGSLTPESLKAAEKVNKAVDDYNGNK